MNGNDTGSRQTSVREILTVVFRRKVPILIVAVTVSVATLTAASRTSSLFQGTAKVLVRRMGATPLVTAWTPFFQLEEEMNTEAEIATSAAVVERTAEILKKKGVRIAHSAGDSQSLREPTIEDISAGISATPVEMSNVILVEFTGPDPGFCVEAANAAAEAYIQYRAPLRSIGVMQDYFGDQLALVEARLVGLNSTELALRRDGEIYDLEWQYQLALTRRNEFQRLFAEARSRRIAEQEKLALARQRIREDPGVLIPFPELTDDKLVEQMRAEYWELLRVRDEKAAFLTDSNPEVQMYNDRVAKMEDRFREEAQRMLKEKEFLLEDLKAEERAYLATAEEISQELRRTPDVVAEITHLQREINYTYSHYDKLLEKMLDSMASEADDIRMSNAKIISPATVELSTVGRMQSMYVAFSVLLGISLGLGFGFLLENMDHSVRSASDIEDGLGVRLLGSVPDSREMPRLTRRVDRTFTNNPK
jgi:succinoglycan biosynthesis transport protein ExoP